MRAIQATKMREEEVEIPIGRAKLGGTLTVPQQVTGIVIFAHGSGSSRFSPRNRHVAEHLQKEGLATLLFDLLTTEEEQKDLSTSQYRFDCAFLAQRLVSATEWLKNNQELENVAWGYFGASTGAAAALMAAVEQPAVIKAVVSRGGRPDLAAAMLSRARAPTLLIVGGEDRQVLGLNKEVLERLDCPKALEIVGGASHLFEEPGALDQVARLAGEWFKKYLRVPK